LAGAFQAPLVIMHTRGHIVPPLANPHLAALRAFLISMRDEGCPESYRYVCGGGGVQSTQPFTCLLKQAEGTVWVAVASLLNSLQVEPSWPHVCVSASCPIVTHARSQHQRRRRLQSHHS
jgi:hypothetical protein